MKKKSLFLYLFLLFALLLLIFPVLSVQGAKDGLLIWYKTILPTLLPFMIVSKILMETKLLEKPCSLLRPINNLLFSFSEKASIALLLGLFFGFPMGAVATTKLIGNNGIKKEEGNLLLSIANNFSPMFVLGFIHPLLPNVPLWNLLLAIYGSPLIFGIIYSKKKNYTGSSTGCSNTGSIPYSFSFATIDNAIMESFSSITKIGGYLILFGVIAKMVTALNTVTTLKAFLLIMTEVTTGITYISTHINTPLLRELFIIPGLCFGGLCGLGQTLSMTKDSGLSIRQYLQNRLIISLISALLTALSYTIRNPQAVHLL